MDIEKLCEEFHEKVGKEKFVKIIVEETAETLPTTEYSQGTFNIRGNVENTKPYMKVRQTDKILHLYSGNFTSSAK